MSDKAASDEENKGVQQPLKHKDDKAMLQAVKHENHVQADRKKQK